MSKVLDFWREEFPAFYDVDDERLTQFIADEFPVFMRVPEFREDYVNQTAPRTSTIRNLPGAYVGAGLDAAKGVAAGVARTAALGARAFDTIATEIGRRDALGPSAGGFRTTGQAPVVQSDAGRQAAVEDMPGHQAAQWLEGIAKKHLKQDQEYVGDSNFIRFFQQDVPAGIGSMATMVPAAMVNPILGVATMFGVEFQDAFEREIDRQKEAGEPLDWDKALGRGTAYGIASSALEQAGGAGRLARRIKKAFGIKVEEAAASGALGRFVRENLKEGAIGAATEGAQRLTQDIIVTGKPEWEEIAREAGAGGVAQLLLGLPANARTAGRSAAQDAPELSPASQPTSDTAELPEGLKLDTTHNAALNGILEAIRGAETMQRLRDVGQHKESRRIYNDPRTDTAAKKEIDRLYAERHAELQQTIKPDGSTPTNRGGLFVGVAATEQTAIEPWKVDFVREDGSTGHIDLLPDFTEEQVREHVANLFPTAEITGLTAPTEAVRAVKESLTAEEQADAQAELDATQEQDLEGAETTIRPDAPSAEVDAPASSNAEQAPSSPFQPLDWQEAYPTAASVRTAAVEALPGLDGILHVVENGNQIPAKYLRKGVDPNAIDGFYAPDTGEIWLNAAQLTDPHTGNIFKPVLRRKLFHEAAGHLGLRRVLGNDALSKLATDVWHSLTESERTAIATRNGLRPGDKTAIGEEWLMYEAERVISENKPNSVWRRVGVAVRKLLRRIGVHTKLDDLEIAKLMRKGWEAVEKPTPLEGKREADETAAETSSPSSGKPRNRKTAKKSSRKSPTRTTQLEKFDRETEEFGADILTFMRESMRMMSKSTAFRTKGKRWWKLNSSLYDGSEGRLSMVHHNLIYAENGMMPDQVAKAAYDSGMLPEPDVYLLWPAIYKASATRKAMYGEAAKQEAEWDKQAEELEAQEAAQDDNVPFSVTDRAGIERELHALRRKQDPTARDKARITQLQSELGQQDLFATDSRDIADVEVEREEAKQRAEIARRQARRLVGGRLETQTDAFAEPQSGQQSFFSVTPDGFYSDLENLVVAKVQGKQASPEQLKAIIRKGSKEEEVKWSGVMQAIDRLASENNGKVQKQALLDHLRDSGRVRFEGHTFGQIEPSEDLRKIVHGRLNRQPQTSEEWLKMSLYLEGQAQDYKRIGYESEMLRYFDLAEEANRIAEGLEDGSTAGTPKFTNYQLPGGENYREVVLAMPDTSSANPVSDHYRIRVTIDGLSRIEHATQPQIDLARRGGRTVEVLGPVIRKDIGENYQSTHFPDVPNYVAHMRLNDRVDADGNPGLFIEEIQSDRHQKGRKEGYETSADSTGWTARRGAFGNSSFWAVYDQNGSFVAERRAETEQAAVEAAARELGTGTIPDAPFRTSWPLHMFKRALREAVATGKAWIGWTTGDTQAERYDLSKQVDAIRLEGDFDQSIEVSVARPGQGFEHLTSTTTGKLEEVVGKDIARKALEDGQREFQGVDLKVGGEGMKGFYDRMLVKEVGKYVKQWGGKVERGEISSGEDEDNWRQFIKSESKTTETVSIHRVDITDAMRKDVSEKGQALFSITPQDLHAEGLDLYNSETKFGKWPYWLREMSRKHPDIPEERLRITWRSVRAAVTGMHQGLSPTAAAQWAQIEAEAEFSENAKAAPMQPFDADVKPPTAGWALRPQAVIGHYSTNLLHQTQLREIRTAYQKAAVQRHVDDLLARARVDVQSRLPQFLRKLIKPARLKRFIHQMTPAAARMNVTGGTPGQWEFTDFKMRAGFLPLRVAQNLDVPVSTGGIYMKPTGTGFEELEVGEKIRLEDGREGYQLLRQMSEGDQQGIYNRFTSEFPELAWMLDTWVDPRLGQSRVTINGVEIPVFNRHSLAGLYAENHPEFKPQEAYTPDVAVPSTIWGTVRRYLKARRASFKEGVRSPGRKYETGAAREAGEIKDILTGFSQRAFQGLQEKTAAQWSKDVLAAATDMPKEGLPDGWTKLETAMDAVWQAIVGLNKGGLDPVAFSETVERLTGDLDSDPKFRAFFGELMRLRGQAKMIPEPLFDAVKKRLTQIEQDKLWTKLADKWAKNWKGLLLAMPDTFAENYVSNHLWTLQAGQRQLIQALMPGQSKDQRRLAIREARALTVSGLSNLIPGMRHAFRLNNQNLFSKTLRTSLPEELFEGQTRLSDLNVQWHEPILDQLKRGEIGPAILNATKYGKIDVAGKRQFAFSLLLAKARQTAKERGLKGKARTDFIEDFVLHPPENVVRRAVEGAQRWLLNYGDMPWLLQKATQHPIHNLFLAFPLFRYHFIGRNIDMATRALRWWWKSKVQGRNLGHQEKVAALADTISLWLIPAMGYAAKEVLAALYDSVIRGALMKQPPEEDDEASIVGSSSVITTDDDGSKVRRRLPRDLITANRLNMSAIARAAGFDSNNDEDIWWHFKDYPIVRGTALVQKMVEDGRRHGVEQGLRSGVSAFRDMLMSMANTGFAVKVGEKLINEAGDEGGWPPKAMIFDPYSQNVPLQAYLTMQLLELIPGNRQANEVIRWIDPVERRMTRNKTLGFDPGASEAVRIGGVTGLASRMIHGQPDDIPAKGVVNRKYGFVENPDEIALKERIANLLGQNIKTVPRYDYEDAVRQE